MSKEFSAVLDQLLDGKSLSEQQANALMHKLAEGDMPAALAGALLALVYIATAAYWYVAQIATLNEPLHVRRGGVLVRPEQAESLHTLVTLVQGESAPGDTLLTVPDLSMLNFLSERSMPSPYYNLYQHHIGHDGGAGVVVGEAEIATFVGGTPVMSAVQPLSHVPKIVSAAWVPPAW